MAKKVVGANKIVSCKIPAWVVAKMDQAAEKEGCSRYVWMQKLISKELGIRYVVRRTGDDRYSWER